MRSRVVAPLAFGFILLVAWQGIVFVADIPEYLLPSPSAIVEAVDRSLAIAFVVTFAEALAGFLVASALAFAVATLFVRFRTLEDGLFPIAIAVKTTPIVAIAPLLVIWLGTGWWSKIVAAILICFFPVLVNTVKGLKAAGVEYCELFETLGASRAQEFRKLRVPFCLPYLFSALKISSSLAVVGAIVGEFVGAKGPWLLDYCFLGASRNADLVFGDLRCGRGRHRHVLRDRLDRAPVDLLVERGGGMSKPATSVNVVRISTKGPGDVSGLLRLIETGKIAPESILAILGKTEGNGGVNDFTREYAMAALCEALSQHLKLTARAVEDKIALVMSGGTEGVLSPHLTVFTRTPIAAAANVGTAGKRLSIGIAHTRDFLPEEIGRVIQIEETVVAVHAAMGDAGIDDASDVHFVQIKCPLLTSGASRRRPIADARQSLPGLMPRWRIPAALQRLAWRKHWAKSRALSTRRASSRTGTSFRRSPPAPPASN